MQPGETTSGTSIGLTPQRSRSASTPSSGELLRSRTLQIQRGIRAWPAWCEAAEEGREHCRYLTGETIDATRTPV